MIFSSKKTPQKFIKQMKPLTYMSMHPNFSKLRAFNYHIRFVKYS